MQAAVKHLKSFIIVVSLPIYSIQQDVMMHDGHTQAAHTMKGIFGNYSMRREASGTSWNPDSTHMPQIHLMRDPWSVMFQGYLNVIYDHQGGPRGSKKFFSENMFMLMARREFEKSILGFHGMFSLEPGTIGKRGYPLLLQTGETANGKTPLIDRQHPHDFLMELAVAYTFLFSDKSSAFLYFGLPGEPALGPPVYMQRFSGTYNPEAPITHHWLDSTHITFGVATFGYIYQGIKIDGSLFTGREPDQNRWDFDRPRFDSLSLRVSYNPTENLSMQLSYGFLKSPEQISPGINIGRLTASLIYNKQWGASNQVQITMAYGQNNNRPGPKLNAGMLEYTAELHNKHIFFGRGEYVEKNELFPPGTINSEKIFKVGKLQGGYLRKYHCKKLFLNCAFGFSMSVSLVPTSLKPFYGGTPFSWMIFCRAEFAE